MSRDGAAAVLLLVAGVLALVAGVVLVDPGAGREPLATRSPGVTVTSTEDPDEVLARPDCEVSDLLVPECGRWWGVAPGALTATHRAVALREFERKVGRRMDVFHSYHRNDALFPTAQERALARDPEGRRLLFINWKPSTGHTWREVADGAVDERIDRLAEHITATYQERFFLTVWHEPENDVEARVGSGMTARDYADMHRHVVQRLRSGGVTNAVTVMTYMGSPVWGSQPWFPDLYPGDDVVDWIGYDPYIFATPKGEIRGSFRDMMNRRGNGWPGFYEWAQAEHPDKPIVVAEWGVFSSETEPWRKAWVFRTVEQEIHQFPAVKALLYFDSPNAPKGDTRIDSSPDAHRAFTDLGRERPFIGPAVPG